MDGYIQNAHIGNKTVIDIDEKTSKFTKSNGKIKGTLSGTITKELGFAEYVGETDKFSIDLNDVYITDKQGANVTVKFSSIGGDSPYSTKDYNCNLTYAELKKHAPSSWMTEGDNQIVISVDNHLYNATIYSDPEDDADIEIEYEKTYVKSGELRWTQYTITVKSDESNSKSSETKYYDLTEVAPMIPPATE